MRVNRNPATTRRGYTLLEVTLTALLLVIAMSLTLKVLAWVALERREIQRRQIALAEVSSAMEKITARHWEQLTVKSAELVKPSAAALESLPGAEWSVSLTPEPKDPDSMRVAIRLRWRNRAQQWDAPVRLSAWVHRRRDQP